MIQIGNETRLITKSLNSFEVYFHHLIFIHYYKILYSIGFKPHLNGYVFCGWGYYCALHAHMFCCDVYEGAWHVVVFLKGFIFFLIETRVIMS